MALALEVVWACTDHLRVTPLCEQTGVYSLLLHRRLRMHMGLRMHMRLLQGRLWTPVWELLWSLLWALLLVLQWG